MEAARFCGGVRPFYAVTVDGRRVLIYGAAGACALVALAILLEPQHAEAAGKVGKVTNHLIREGVRHLPKHNEMQVTHGIVNDALSPLHQRRLLPASVYRRLLQNAHDRYELQRVLQHWQRFHGTRKLTNADIDLAGAMKRIQQDLSPVPGPSPIEMWKEGFKEYARLYGDLGRGVLRIIKHIGHARLSGQWPYVPPGAPGIGGGTGLPM